MSITEKLEELQQRYSSAVQQLQSLDNNRNQLTQELLQVQGAIQALKEVSTEEEE